MSALLQHLYDIGTIVKLPNTFTVIRLNILLPWLTMYLLPYLQFDLVPFFHKAHLPSSPARLAEQLQIPWVPWPVLPSN